MSKTVSSLSPDTSSPVAPLVTIAIPTFNRANFLGDAIRSALAQSYANVEVVVSDNASTDGTSELLSDFHDSRLRVIRQTRNVGLLGNWNSCLYKAQGAYFIMLSDDDELKPTAIVELLNAIRCNDCINLNLAESEIAFSYGSSQVHETIGDVTRVSHSAPTLEPSVTYRVGYLYGQRINYPSATLFRTVDMLSVGGYGAHGKATIDTALAFAISEQRKFVAFTGTVTTYYSLHPENYTSSASIDAHVDSAVALADMSVAMIENLPCSQARATKRAARWIKANTLGYMLLQAHFAGTVGARQIFHQMWQYRRFFDNPTSWLIFLKFMIRFILFRTLGVRQIFVKR